MNSRITNQIHQLSTKGEIVSISLSADTVTAISAGISIPTDATHVQVMAEADAYYRSDGISGDCPFPLAGEDPAIFTRQDFVKTYITSDTAQNIYLQFMGE